MFLLLFRYQFNFFRQQKFLNYYFECFVHFKVCNLKFFHLSQRNLAADSIITTNWSSLRFCKTEPIKMGLLPVCPSGAFSFKPVMILTCSELHRSSFCVELKGKGVSIHAHRMYSCEVSKKRSFSGHSYFVCIPAQIMHFTSMLGYRQAALAMVISAHDYVHFD